ATRLRRRRRRLLARRDRGRLPGPARAAQDGRGRGLAGRPVRPDKDFPRRKRKEPLVDRALRLVATNPVDELARTIEALLVIASAPLSVDELAGAANDDPERVEAALELLGERYREGRSGIVLEHVA